MSKIVLFFLIFIISGNCTFIKNSKSDNTIHLDTTKSVKIADLWITPNLSFEFISLGICNLDTLDFIGCSDYLYYPFGKLKERQDLKSSVLKEFEIYESKKDTSTITDEEGKNGYFVWQERLKLKYGSNTLNLFFDDGNEGEKHSYITNGEIISKDIVFINGVRIGMNFDDFCSKFFDSFPKELHNKYEVITFETCTDGLRHIYTFKNNILISIEFR